MLDIHALADVALPAELTFFDTQGNHGIGFLKILFLNIVFAPPELCFYRRQPWPELHRAHVQCPGLQHRPPHPRCDACARLGCYLILLKTIFLENSCCAYSKHICVTGVSQHLAGAVLATLIEQNFARPGWGSAIEFFLKKKCTDVKMLFVYIYF